MKAFYLAALFGAFQMLIDYLLGASIKRNLKGTVWLWSIIKFITYAVVLGILYFKFPSSVTVALSGFLSGLVLSAVIYYIVILLFKKYKTNK